MTIEPADEAPRASDDPAFRDAVTFSFGDRAAGAFGVAELGFGDGAADGFAVVCADGAPAVTATEAGVVLDGAPSAWDEVRAAGVVSSVVAPLEAWTVRCDEPRAGFDLRFQAISSPAVIAPETPVAAASGMVGYEQLCSVTGTVRVSGRKIGVRCLGQRGRRWGTPDSGSVALTRSLSLWLGADRAVILAAVRPTQARSHEDEAVAAFVVEGGQPLEVVDALLSTTYDAGLRQRRAGLELWMQEDGGFARRAAGEALCATTVALGELRLESAAFSWRMEGREGTGRYDVLRRADAADETGSGRLRGVLRRR